MKKILLMCIQFLLVFCQAEKSDLEKLNNTNLNKDSVVSSLNTKIIEQTKKISELKLKVETNETGLDLSKTPGDERLEDNVVVLVNYHPTVREVIIGGYIFYKTSDSLYTLQENNFPDYGSFSRLLEQKRFLTLFSGGRRSGILEVEKVEPFSNYVRFKNLTIPDTITTGFTTIETINLLNSIATTAEINDLQTKLEFPKDKELALAKKEAIEKFRIITEREFDETNLKIEKLDIIKGTEDYKKVGMMSATLTFHMDLPEKIDLFQMFGIIDYSKEPLETEVIHQFHIQSTGEGYGKTMYFVDIFDIDEDNEYEIFCIEYGYENADLIILKNIDGKWRRFKTINYYNI
ncbi:MAG: hypothetical protein SCALA702_00420 [Melioribacteraceae bacterium]|nr:MAG: hypothetical protein SCALA702_00420 [Melioribacteraceae bacterium]